PLAAAPDSVPAPAGDWPGLGEAEGVGAGALYPEPPVGYDMSSSPRSSHTCVFTTDSLLTLLHRGAEVITERFPCGENRRLWITTKAATGEPEAAFEDPYGDQAVTLAFSRIARASADRKSTRLNS